jgi:manganese/zinc/iron transport system substrate-binding protein
VLLLAGLSAYAAADRTEPPPLRVVATVGMVTDLIKGVGGGKVDLHQIVGSGVDPHLYSPTRRDVLTLQRAEVIFLNGLNLEGQMGEVLNRMSRRGKRVVALSEELYQREQPLAPSERRIDPNDPHLWMDVSLWIAALEIVRETLAAERPDQADFFTANATAFRAELENLDRSIRELIQDLPPDRRILVTAHDAFGYFGRAYGFEVRGIQGISTESEAGLRDIEGLIDFLVERDIPAIFLESSVSDRNVRAIIEGSRARGHDLDIGGILFADAMGIAQSEQGTYQGMMRHNVKTIVSALGARQDLSAQLASPQARRIP